MIPSEGTPEEDKESPEHDTSSSLSLGVLAGRDFKKGAGERRPSAWHIPQQLCIAPFPKGLFFLRHSLRSLLVSGLTTIYHII